MHLSGGCQQKWKMSNKITQESQIGILKYELSAARCCCRDQAANRVVERKEREGLLELYLPRRAAQQKQKGAWWSKEELYDEYGEPRERTDGGRAPKRKKEATGSEITTHAKWVALEVFGMKECRPARF
eukprot:1159497-Pelagomonas_calceolata.AAC.2